MLGIVSGFKSKPVFTTTLEKIFVPQLFIVAKSCSLEQLLDDVWFLIFHPVEDRFLRLRRRLGGIRSHSLESSITDHPAAL